VTTTNLAELLTREHRDIDGGIERFVAGLDRGAPDPEPLLSAFAALRRHIYLEETFLFPPLRQGGMVMPVMVMLREHGTLWRLMDSIAALLAANAPVAELEPGCRELLAELDRHNGKEEPIIYPRAATDLGPDASADLADFLVNGTTPKGWVCRLAAA
jgi:iron-sulfur cluster repair protein YtfE (RIC family)